MDDGLNDVVSDLVVVLVDVSCLPPDRPCPVSAALVGGGRLGRGSRAIGAHWEAVGPGAV